MVDKQKMPSESFDQKLLMEFDLAVELDDVRRAKAALEAQEVPGPLLEESMSPQGKIDLALLGAVLQRDELEEGFQSGNSEQRQQIGDRLRYQEDRVVELRRQNRVMFQQEDPS